MPAFQLWNQNQTPEQGQCFMPVPLLKQNAWGGMLWQVVIGLEFLWPLWDTLSSCYRLGVYSATIYWQDMEILKEILYFVCFGAAHLEKGYLLI
ncbi:hypothetical protein D9758_017303 [Tetrapyrgos nigripes]|uniref:Uncharacterized protein n=1 Tax=Tetrapyrgos nigripes TaxID=182062 RepID=A0A8H5C1Q8_9AGAR|nr:hypothetical protein D9758_017303 [Tetrapyrgos nigripes]